jgi:hypothetical protein
MSNVMLFCISACALETCMLTWIAVSDLLMTASYAATVLTGLVVEDSWGGAGKSYNLIPVVGPFL